MSIAHTPAARWRCQIVKQG